MAFTTIWVLLFLAKSTDDVGSETKQDFNPEAATGAYEPVARPPSAPPVYDVHTSYNNGSQLYGAQPYDAQPYGEQPTFGNRPHAGYRP